MRPRRARWPIARSPGRRSWRPTATRLGLGVTAALVTDRPKQGDHRAHLAIASHRHPPVLWTVTLDKGARSRAGEDRLVSDLALVLVARACGITTGVDVDLLPGDLLDRSDGGPARS